MGQKISSMGLVTDLTGDIRFPVVDMDEAAAADRNKYATPAQITTSIGSATETTSGIVELATTSEVTTGTDATRAVTPAGVATKAPLASPALTGTPTAPTAAPGTNTTQISTTAFVKAAIDVVLGGVAGAFDTLAELATGLATKLTAASNLSDVANAVTARSNLGVKNQTVQIFTASGTWTKPAGCTAVLAEVIGGGGGSGGVAATIAGQISVSPGAGSGGYSRKLITAPGATETVTIGAGGAAGAAGNNNGSTGGTTSFGAHCSATGGVHSNGGAATAANANTTGGAGGVGSGGDLNIKGQAGDTSLGHGSNALLCPGVGGASHYGGGGAAGLNAVGTVGGNYGGGAGGSSNAASQSDRAGAAGAGGLVIVTEYYN